MRFEEKARKSAGGAKGEVKGFSADGEGKNSGLRICDGAGAANGAGRSGNLSKRAGTLAGIRTSA